MTELTLAVAQKILADALAHCREQKFNPMAVVVLDAAGGIKAAASEDNTTFMRWRVAHGKAYGAVALGMEQKQGIDTKAHYWQGDFDYTTQPDQSERANAAHYKLSGYTELPVSGSAAKQAIKEAISQGLPVPIGFTVHKSFNSAFEQTGLDRVLEQLGASHIVLAGATTNWCIRATAYAALERGYDLTLVKDAHTTESMELPGGRRIEAKDIIDDLNVAMRWLSYPGRVNGTATAAEVDFEAPGGTRSR